MTPRPPTAEERATPEGMERYSQMVRELTARGGANPFGTRTLNPQAPVPVGFNAPVPAQVAQTQQPVQNTMLPLNPASTTVAPTIMPPRNLNLPNYLQDPTERMLAGIDIYDNFYGGLEGNDPNKLRGMAREIQMQMRGRDPRESLEQRVQLDAINDRINYLNMTDPELNRQRLLRRAIGYDDSLRSQPIQNPGFPQPFPINRGQPGNPGFPRMPIGGNNLPQDGRGLRGIAGILATMRGEQQPPSRNIFDQINARRARRGNMFDMFRNRQPQPRPPFMNNPTPPQLMPYRNEFTGGPAYPARMGFGPLPNNFGPVNQPAQPANTYPGYASTTPNLGQMQPAQPAPMMNQPYQPPSLSSLGTAIQSRGSGAQNTGSGGGGGIF